MLKLKLKLYPIKAVIHATLLFFILLRHIPFSVVLQSPCLISRHGCHTRSPFDEGEGRGKKLKSSPFSKKKLSLGVDGNNF